MPFMLLCGLALGLPLAVVLAHAAVLALTGSEAAAWACAALAALALLAFGHHLDRRYNLSWMMRSFAFTARQARREVPQLERGASTRSWWSATAPARSWLPQSSRGRCGAHPS
jgi:hypothetical protein